MNDESYTNINPATWESIFSETCTRIPATYKKVPQINITDTKILPENFLLHIICLNSKKETNLISIPPSSSYDLTAIISTNNIKDYTLIIQILQDHNKSSFHFFKPPSSSNIEHKSIEKPWQEFSKTEFSIFSDMLSKTNLTQTLTAKEKEEKEEKEKEEAVEVEEAVEAVILIDIAVNMIDLFFCPY